jgi:hypothetical protein
MKIPRGIPDPGRVAGKVTGAAGEPKPARLTGPVQQSQRGLAGSPTPPPADSTGGLMVRVLLETVKGAARDLKADRAAKAAAHETKIGAKEAQRDKLGERQEAERNAAWVNVGLAVASAGVSVAGAAVTGSPRGPLSDLAIGQRKALVDTIGHVQKGAMADATAAFEKVFTEGGMPTDINALVQHVLRESYLESSKDLASYAEKVKHFNDQKKAIRDQIGGLREGMPEQQRALEDQLQTAGDDAQLANIDLQNALQKTQQTLQTMSNVSKMLHDTGMAVIRKIG